jgi:hypothetical protein
MSDERESNSPVCYMDEADDAYMGYASRDELVAFLNELLEAERAGSRVTLESAHEAGGGAIGDLLAAIERDEARWCAMLLGQVKALGGAPTPNLGAFYGKAMAIAEMDARIAFLNRGQGWVVKKLREMLPKVRDDKLHADLKAMLESHVENIAKTNAVAAASK